MTNQLFPNVLAPEGTEWNETYTERRNTPRLTERRGAGFGFKIVFQQKNMRHNVAHVLVAVTMKEARNWKPFVWNALKQC